MKVIVHDNCAFRIPSIPSRYRANCNKEWGSFVGGETKNMSFSEAEKAGLTKGKFVEMAICWIDNKILTFEPHYINENFTEIWGIPVSGGIKESFSDKCSELSTFLMHRQSKDKMAGLVEQFAKDAFNQWVAEGMKGDPTEYAIAKTSEAYLGNIFRFDLVKTEGKNGAYFYIQTTSRKPEGEFELAALKAAKEIYQGQIDGLGYCTDERLVVNQANCQLVLAANEGSETKLLTADTGKAKGKAK